ncbi:SDR family NAD(P)-dependent oxidoreductase [Actinospongicola halichondriae]|uniref:SDR family NAD(P)-dependent oxidoreductase n=1 Tax=Actinospongicola halichondriae TaxID=3236844 RepID=UPI003D50A80A
MNRLAGKICVVTGGASGIGEAVVERFRAEGATVAVVDLAATADHPCDVTDPTAVASTFGAIAAEHGRIDVLVTSAGIANVGTLESTSPEDFDKVFAVNVRGVYLTMQAAVAHMGPGSAICNLASIASVMGIPDRFAYSMSKGAVLTMTLSAATDLVDRGIRVNAISPARVHTPFVDRFIADNYPGRESEMFDSLAATQPIGRMGEPAEIAGLALWLCSDEASFVTGSNHLIDGGFTGVRK